MVASQYSMNVFFVNRVTAGRGAVWGTGPGECKCGGGGGFAREAGCLPSGLITPHPPLRNASLRILTRENKVRLEME